MSAANRLPDYLDQMIRGAMDAVTFTEGMDEGDFLADLKTQRDEIGGEKYNLKPI